MESKDALDTCRDRFRKLMVVSRYEFVQMGPEVALKFDAGATELFRTRVNSSNGNRTHKYSQLVVFFKLQQTKQQTTNAFAALCGTLDSADAVNVDLSFI